MDYTGPIIPGVGLNHLILKFNILMINYNFFKISVFFLLFFLIVLTGCAEFKATGIRRVEHRPERIGTIEEIFDQYFP